jgi:hypothetical protein
MSPSFSQYLNFSQEFLFIGDIHTCAHT